MAARDRNKGSALYDQFIRLNRHMKVCNACRGAEKTRSSRSMCDEGVELTLKAARMYDVLAKMRRAAHDDPRGFVYPCPDLGAHGPAYANTVIPMVVAGMQGELF